MPSARTVVSGDVSEGLWRAFQEDSLGVAPERSDHALVLARWSRARSLGAPTDCEVVDDTLVRGEALRARAERLEMLEALGSALLGRVAREVSERDFVLLLADPEGVVVRSEGGGGFRDVARRVRLIEGARWSERVRGTNAIGTAAIEGRPTTVIGAAHYARSYHQLACYAAPIFDPRGHIVAVLDATGTAERARPELGQLVTAAADSLSELLRLEAYAAAGGSMVRLLTGLLERSHEPLLLVEAGGYVSQINGAGRDALGSPQACSLEELLGVGWPALMSSASGRRRVECATPVGPRSFELHVDALGTASDPLAAVVRLEPVKARPAPALSARPDPFAKIFADDPALRRAIDWARVLAASELPVMLLAETGAGKELFAEAIHAASSRAAGPLVAVNCGAIAPSLLETELFGYAPGAFTGSEKKGRAGFFQAAHGGTLFLDEVAEMPLAMQTALLRVLETGTFHRVGESKVERVDVRVVCATCRDLEAALAAGQFRQDLYYRLKGATLRLPALRQRSDRIGLAEHLLADRAPRAGWGHTPLLSAPARAALLRYAWPGNVRELVTALDVALVTARGHGATRVELEHLPLEIHEEAQEPSAPGTLARVEAEALLRTLTAHRGNVSAACRELGIARSTLYRLARRFGIDVKAPR